MGWDGFLGMGNRGAAVTPAMGVAVHPETDDAFRRRLRYVAGAKDAPKTLHQIEVAADTDLDDVAEEFGLKRWTAAQVAIAEKVERERATEKRKR